MGPLQRSVLHCELFPPDVHNWLLKQVEAVNKIDCLSNSGRRNKVIGIHQRWSHGGRKNVAASGGHVPLTEVACLLKLIRQPGWRGGKRLRFSAIQRRQRPRFFLHVTNGCSAITWKELNLHLSNKSATFISLRLGMQNRLLVCGQKIDEALGMVSRISCHT